ncbi:MAG TPA: TolC family protein, partial [Opitutaceae bacterium]
MKLPTLIALALATTAPAALADAQQQGPLTLTGTIDSVIAHYPSLDAARAAVDAARARTMQSNASRLPQVTGNGGYTYNSLRPYVAFAAPGQHETAIYETVQDSYNVNVTARQLLTDFGRTDKLVEMARSGQIAAEDALEEARHQLGYQAIQSFYGVLLLRNSVDVAREEIAALEEALRIAQKKFNAGSATKFDVLTTQVRLSNASNNLTDTQSSLEKQENGLRQLLGWDIAAPLDLRGDFNSDAAVISESAAIADGLHNRPEMKIAIDNEHTARLQLDAASRGNRPSLNAQVSGGMEDGVAPALYDNKGYVQAGLA